MAVGGGPGKEVRDNLLDLQEAGVIKGMPRLIALCFIVFPRCCFFFF